VGDLVLVDRTLDGVAVLTLNRPEALNAIDTALQRELVSRAKACDSDSAIRCLVLAGAGRGFCAGYDIHEMAGQDETANIMMMLDREEVIWQLSTLSTPTIAALHGPVYGAGALLAVGADLRVGGKSTVFKFSAGQYGGANFTWNLPLLIGWGYAKDLLLTARAVGSEEASSMGLLSRLVADDEVLPRALELASAIAAHPPEGLKEIKRLLHDAVGRRWQDMYEAENTAMLTTLRPRPQSETFSSFLAKHSSS
jgi:2-(1,2-epoxy-1,2-dihydrophenyl)acetyl-CoA isomerase